MNKKDFLPARSELTGTSDLINQFQVADNSSRIQMADSQAQQVTMPDSPDLPICLTGFEPQLAKTTMAIRMPCNGVVLELISKFIPSAGYNGIKENTLTTIIYQDDETNAVGHLDLTQYYRGHDVFVVPLVLTSVARNLRVGMPICKGEILAASVGALTPGGFTNGLRTEILNMGIAGVVEDGFIASRQYLDRASPTAMCHREVMFGRSAYPINVYGDENTFKPFPGPGESVRKDKLLFATRRYDQWLDGINMLSEMLNEVYYYHDETVYVPEECIDGKVCDVTVHSANTGTRLRQTPSTMEDYLNGYINQRLTYSDRIVNFDKKFYRQYGSVKKSPAFEKLVTDCLADRPNDPDRQIYRQRPQGTVQYIYKLNPIDEWRINIDVSWKFKLGLGSKLACGHGNKGVVCAIMDETEMPRNEHGDVCDLVQNGTSVYARMNVGQEYEKYFSAACRDVAKDVRAMIKEGKWEEAFEHAMGLLEIIAPLQHDHFRSVKTTDMKKRDWLLEIEETTLYALVTSDSGVICPETIKRIRNYRRPNYSPIHYKNYDGNWVTTKRPMLIGPKQMYVLDKSSFKPMAVSVSQRQQHGLPATTNKRTKVAYPTTRNPPRAWGEAEQRGNSAAMGGEAISYSVDVTVNPAITKDVVMAMLESGNSFNEPYIYDRKKHPVGAGRNIGFVKNIFSCMGIEIVDSNTNVN